MGRLYRTYNGSSVSQRVLGTSWNYILSELSNSGHRHWDPMLHPDWLLLEIESDISTRQVRARIAKEMISPSSGCGLGLESRPIGDGVPLLLAASSPRPYIHKKPVSPRCHPFFFLSCGLALCSCRRFSFPVLSLAVVRPYLVP